MSSRRVLAAVAVVALFVVGLWLWRGRAGPPPLEIPEEGAPQGIRANNVAVASPDLDVKLVEIRGTAHPEYTDWSCILECREADGCRADIQLVIEYRSDGATKKVLMGSRLDAATGETMRIGRVQRPPIAVDSIDRATLSVLEAYRSNSPKPTQIE
jgi:hypothetical protein